MSVTGVSGEQLLCVDLLLSGVGDEAGCARNVVQVVVVGSSAVDHDRTLLHDAERGDNSSSGGVIVGVRRIVWVVRQRVATT